jgi:hypothetical protein
MANEQEHTEQYRADVAFAQALDREFNEPGSCVAIYAAHQPAAAGAPQRNKRKAETEPDLPNADLKDVPVELQCPVCMEAFFEPRILGCGHSLCNACCVKVGNSTSSKCPTCRRAFSYQSGAPPPINFTAQAAVDSFIAMQTPDAQATRKRQERAWREAKPKRISNDLNVARSAARAWDPNLHCWSCAIQFPHAAALLGHLALVHGRDPPSAELRYCGLCPVNGTRDAVDQHVRLVHAEWYNRLPRGGSVKIDAIIYSCLCCPYSYFTARDRDEHQHAMHGFNNDGSAAARRESGPSGGEVAVVRPAEPAAAVASELRYCGLCTHSGTRDQVDQHVQVAPPTWYERLPRGGRATSNKIIYSCFCGRKSFWTVSELDAHKHVVHYSDDQEEPAVARGGAAAAVSVASNVDVSPIVTQGMQSLFGSLGGSRPAATDAAGGGAAADGGSDVRVLNLHTCVPCSHRFRTYDAYMNHRCAGHTRSTWTVPCGICLRQFMTRASYITHVCRIEQAFAPPAAARHDLSRPHRCQYCRLPFDSFADYTAHESSCECRIRRNRRSPGNTG